MEERWWCRLENVQMAGHNGGVLIACLQISHCFLLVCSTVTATEEPVCRRTEERTHPSWPAFGKTLSTTVLIRWTLWSSHVL